jgi:hypothetical protein
VVWLAHVYMVRYFCLGHHLNGRSRRTKRRGGIGVCVYRIISDVAGREADARLSEAIAKQKQAELKLAELEHKVIPRVIGDDDEAKIIDALKQFSGTPFSIEYAPAAEYEFVNRVFVILEKAGWQRACESPWYVSPPMPGAGAFQIPPDQTSGVRISAPTADFSKPAETLANLLTQALKAGVGISYGPEDSHLVCPANSIHIIIGKKL